MIYIVLSISYLLGSVNFAIIIAKHKGINITQEGSGNPGSSNALRVLGKKYALGNLLLIDDTADADATNNHGKVASAKAKVKPELKGEALKKAKAAIKAGTFTIADVEKKYTISPATLKTL